MRTSRIWSPLAGTEAASTAGSPLEWPMLSSGNDHKSFGRFRTKAAKTAGLLSVAAAVALLVIYHFQPSVDPVTHAAEKGKLSPELFNVGQTLVTTLLGIGLLSLFFEVLLREEYGQDLLRFLNLRTAIVRSGLQHIVSESDYAWEEILSASAVTILVRNPSDWLVGHLPMIISSCEKRATDVRILVPDADGNSFAALAETAGLSPADLRRNVDVAVQTAQTQWRAQQPRLNVASRMEFVPYQGLALHDLASGDEKSVILLPRAIDHHVGDVPLAVALSQVATDYPTNWIMDTLKRVHTSNPVWAGRVS